MGLYRAPATKVLLACVGTASVASTLPLRRLVVEQLSDSMLFSRGWELWKIVLNKVFFSDPKDMVCGLMLIYYFRIFERRYGTRKFVSQMMAAGLMSLSLELAVLTASAKFGMPQLAPFPSGPFGMVFSFFIAYSMDIPRVTFSHILGVPVTGKTLAYLLGLQMACGSMPSFCAAASGLLSGLLYRLNFAKMQSWLCVPEPVARLCSKLVGRWLDPPSAAPSHPPNMGATLELQQQQQRELLEEQMMAAAAFEGNRFFAGGGPFGGPPHDVDQVGRLRRRRVPSPPPPVAPPSEEQIAQLVEMGFPRERVLQALQTTSNDVHSAAIILLHEQH